MKNFNKKNDIINSQQKQIDYLKEEIYKRDRIINNLKNIVAKASIKLVAMNKRGEK